MIGKKLMALVVVGGLTASIGMSAGAFTKTVSTKTKINIKQVQKQMLPSPIDIKAKLDSLVKAGTITQVEEDKLIPYINTKEAALKAEIDKVKNMTQADRKTYMQSKVKEEGTNLATDLVTSGTLTQAEVDSLKGILPKIKGQLGFNVGGERNGQGFGKGAGARFRNPANMQSKMKAKLDTLVKAGTITQAIENSVITYTTQAQTAKIAEMDKVKAMSAADRKAYMASKVKVARTAPFTDLVKSGTLTQAQADAITKGQFGGLRGKVHLGGTKAFGVKNQK